MGRRPPATQMVNRSEWIPRASNYIIIVRMTRQLRKHATKKSTTKYVPDGCGKSDKLNTLERSTVHGLVQGN